MSKKLTHDGNHWSNADEDRIEITVYNTGWPKLFQKERQRLLSILPGDIDFTIKHFGSTAIPGMAAKPIIDILLLCPEKDQWEQFIEPLESLGYLYWEDNPRKDRMFFVKGMPPYGNGRTHHVHVMKPETANRSLLFLDYMKENPEEIRRYEEIKRRLMKLYPTDREKYTKEKKNFIEKIIARAKSQHGTR